MKSIVKCGDCSKFKPDSDYKKPGICQGFEGIKDIKDAAYKARGGCEFLDCTRRFCSEYSSKGAV